MARYELDGFFSEAAPLRDSGHSALRRTLVGEQVSFAEVPTGSKFVFADPDKLLDGLPVPDGARLLKTGEVTFQVISPEGVPDEAGKHTLTDTAEPVEIKEMAKRRVRRVRESLDTKMRGR